MVRPDRPRGRDGRPPEDKIAAIGIRLRHWISFHGIAVNVAPELGHFSGIVPCGIADHGVTSLADLGLAAGMAELDRALAHAFAEVFGPAVLAAPVPAQANARGGVDLERTLIDAVNS